MLGLTASLHPPLPIPIPSISRPFPVFLHNNLIHPSLFLKTQTQNPKTPKRFVIHADNGNGLGKDSKERDEGDDGFNGGDELKRDRRPIFNLRWGDLLYPDPDNILAVGLTGLLTWASVQVLWQLFFISLAIIVAAVKYSFIAALLLFILITLL